MIHPSAFEPLGLRIAVIDEPRHRELFTGCLERLYSAQDVARVAATANEDKRSGHQADSFRASADATATS